MNLHPQPTTPNHHQTEDEREERGKKCPLLTLPPELHLQITTHLPLLPDIYSLQATCTYFYTLLPPPTLAALLAAETTDFAIAHDLYACRYCLRLRPGSVFADRMLRRGRGRYGRDRAKRFCVDCGVMPRGEGEGEEARYGFGALVRVEGELRVFCGGCGGLRRVGMVLGVAGAVGVGGKRERVVCEGCWGVAGWI
ncbi:hypothetical protein AbraCBS73388_008678 [Aspergillus brasiliensis]|uniref:F-box domain-containing protein n=2 Tax=Aspergillus brasiliensis TaxID=319629 RepID=A0A1L9USM6_ASPBC|nr:hypothetical protein ASPBRDRAFT_39728 [Aspergillus brasiliensis CBS 101740]GKZ22518.1 hypothetical protein AbraCBS73388_008678 [Aspergillus brasiliensis]